MQTKNASSNGVLIFNQPINKGDIVLIKVLTKKKEREERGLMIFIKELLTLIFKFTKYLIT
jgi:hypothetical protein